MVIERMKSKEGQRNVMSVTDHNGRIFFLSFDTVEVCSLWFDNLRDEKDNAPTSAENTPKLGMFSAFDRRSPRNRGKGREISRKLAVLGFRGVGKSTLVTQFVENRFVEHYDPTIENTFHTEVTVKNVTFVCSVVDTAGMDEYTSVPRSASVGVHGYVMLYSMTSRSSFLKLHQIHERLLNDVMAGEVPRVLVASMSDLDELREVTTQEGVDLARSWGIPFLESSAKRNHNVHEVFNLLLREIEKSENSGLLEGSREASLFQARNEECTVS
jgi:Ras family protein